MRAKDVRPVEEEAQPLEYFLEEDFDLSKEGLNNIEGLLDKGDYRLIKVSDAIDDESKDSLHPVGNGSYDGIDDINDAVGYAF